MHSRLVLTLTALLLACATTSPGPLRAQALALDAASRARRDQWQRPAQVLDDVGIQPGMTVADIGAREGYYTFYLAQRVGPGGKVLAEDIDGGALEHLRKRLAEERVGNVSVVLGGETDTRLPPGSVDIAFLSNVLCCADHPVQLLSGIHTILKPSGRLVVVQGLNKRDHTLAWVQGLISDAGYTVKQMREHPGGPHVFVCESRRKG